jgi:hypothetical protein
MTLFKQASLSEYLDKNKIGKQKYNQLVLLVEVETNTQKQIT